MKKVEGKMGRKLPENITEFKFIEIESGEEILFQLSEDAEKTRFLWSNQFQFHRIDE